MKIQGFQKLTLLDYPGIVACTVFTGGCNFRCPFCHNASLVVRTDENNDIDEDMIFEYLKKRRGILDGVCVTGGEPLLQGDIIEFISKIKDIGYKVKIDTNGAFPEKLKNIVDLGLCDYVAMDIKNSPEKYGITIGVPNYDITPVLKSVAYLMEKHVQFEFRTTLVKELHTYEDIEKIGEWIRGDEPYFLQNFKDSGDIISSGFSKINEIECGNMLNIAKKYLPNAGLRGV